MWIDLRRFLTWTALITVFLVALLGILMIFSVIKFKDYNKFFFSCVTIAIGFSFALSSYNLYQKRKTILPLISLILILASIVLVISALFFGSNSETFIKITVTIAIISVLFTIIVENTIKLGRRYLALQIIIYLLILYLLSVILLALWSIWSGFNTYFWVIAIIAFSGLIALGVLSKKEGNPSLAIDDVEYIKISKEEYDYLLKRSQQLEELTKDNK